MSNTKVFKRAWNGKEMFAVFPVNENGERTEGTTSKSLIQFGIKKAKAILKHMSELEEFVKENDK